MQIDLSSEKYLASGSQRICYLNPLNDGQCIKIAKKTHKARLMQAKEVRYLLKSASALKSPHIYQYYGSVDTSKGPGEVFELVRDYTGEISQNLTSLKSAGNNIVYTLKSELNQLKTHLKEQRILVHDLSHQNVLCQHISPDESRLVLVDGVGDPSLFGAIKNLGPLYHFSFNRRWARFLRRLTM